MMTRGTFGGGVTGKRSGNRLRLGLAGRLELTRGTLDCTVENVSLSGARITIAAPLERGCPARLHIAERVLFASVVWTHGRICALRFDRRVPAAEMQRFLWIADNREQYERERHSTAAREWSTGLQAGPSDAQPGLRRSTSPARIERRRVPRPAKRSA